MTKLIRMIFNPGYCDVFLKCRKVDAEGPLVRLKNLLFNQETFLTISTWVTQHWWAVLLMGIAMVIFMAIFIKCCGEYIRQTWQNAKIPNFFGDFWIAWKHMWKYLFLYYSSYSYSFLKSEVAKEPAFYRNSAKTRQIFATEGKKPNFFFLILKKCVKIQAVFFTRVLYNE